MRAEGKEGQASFRGSRVGSGGSEGAGWETLQRRPLWDWHYQTRRSLLFAGRRKSGHLGCCGSWGAGRARPPNEDGRGKVWSQRLWKCCAQGPRESPLWPGLREPSTEFWPTVWGPVVEGSERAGEAPQGHCLLLGRWTPNHSEPTGQIPTEPLGTCRGHVSRSLEEGAQGRQGLGQT